jgi:hypothetical protein
MRNEENIETVQVIEEQQNTSKRHLQQVNLCSIALVSVFTIFIYILIVYN